MKRKIIFLVFGLLLILPNIGSATNPTTDPSKDQEMKCPDDCPGKHGHFMNKHWQEKMREREQQLSTWVDQYTPEKKEEWTKLLQERKALRDKWLSPEFASKREKWKQEKMTKMQELKKQYEEGKITKEELMKKAHGGKDFSHWKTYHELKKAVESKNDAQAKQLLNQLLEQYKQHNEMIKERMSQK